VLDRAAPTGAKTKIVTDNDMLRTQFSDQQRIDKAIMAQITHGTESRAEHFVDTKIAQDFDAFAQAGQPGWRIIQCEKLGRHRLERKDHRRPFAPGCEIAYAIQDFPMTEMNAVECPDRDHAL
jgi:hypothetical protein